MTDKLNGSLIDLVASLADLMEQESVLLEAGGPADLGELAGAKLRLTARLERESATRARKDPAWQTALAPGPRKELATSVSRLHRAASVNHRLLERQIDLSRDLLDAIAGEAKRAGGTRFETYGARGGLLRSELPAPISVNANL